MFDVGREAVLINLGIGNAILLWVLSGCLNAFLTIISTTK
jgi:hypothetical protein